MSRGPPFSIVISDSDSDEEQKRRRQERFTKKVKEEYYDLDDDVVVVEDGSRTEIEETNEGDVVDEGSKLALNEMEEESRLNEENHEKPLDDGFHVGYDDEFEIVTSNDDDMIDDDKFQQSLRESMKKEDEKGKEKEEATESDFEEVEEIEEDTEEVEHMDFPSSHWSLLRSGGTIEGRKAFYDFALNFLLQQRQHFWCKHGKIARELLFLFDEESQIVSEGAQHFVSRSFKQLQQCYNCVVKYYEAKSYQDIILSRSHQLLEFMTLWDSARLKKTLKTQPPKQNSPALLELLSHPSLLLNQHELANLTAKHIKSIILDLRTKPVEEPLPGVWLFVFHKDTILRHWAISFVRRTVITTEIQFLQIQPIVSWIVDTILSQLASPGCAIIELPAQFVDSVEEFWSGVSILLPLFSQQVLLENFLKSYNVFIEVIVHMLYNTTFINWAVKYLLHLVKTLMGDFWSNTGCEPQVIFNQVVSSFPNMNYDQQRKAIEFLLVITTSVPLLSSFKICAPSIVDFLLPVIDKHSTDQGSRQVSQDALQALFKILHDGFTRRQTWLPFTLTKSNRWISLLVTHSMNPITANDTLSELLAAVLDYSTEAIAQAYGTLLRGRTDRPSLTWVRELWVAVEKAEKATETLPFAVCSAIIASHRNTALLDREMLQHMMSDRTAAEVFTILKQYQTVVSFILTKLNRDDQVDRATIATRLLEQPRVTSSLMSFLVASDKSARDSLGRLLQCHYSRCTRLMEALLSVQEDYFEFFYSGICLLVDQMKEFGGTNCTKACGHFFQFLRELLPRALESLPLEIDSEVAEKRHAVVKTMLQDLWVLIERMFRDLHAAENQSHQLCAIQFLDFLKGFLPILLDQKLAMETGETVLSSHGSWAPMFLDWSKIRHLTISRLWFECLLIILSKIRDEGVELAPEIRDNVLVWLEDDDGWSNEQKERVRRVLPSSREATPEITPFQEEMSPPPTWRLPLPPSGVSLSSSPSISVSISPSPPPPPVVSRQSKIRSFFPRVAATPKLTYDVESSGPGQPQLVNLGDYDFDDEEDLIDYSESLKRSKDVGYISSEDETTFSTEFTTATTVRPKKTVPPLLSSSSSSSSSYSSSALSRRTMEDKKKKAAERDFTLTRLRELERQEARSKFKQASYTVSSKGPSTSSSSYPLKKPSNPLADKLRARARAVAASYASKKPICQYGLKCYRQNPEHFEEFQHPVGHPYTLKLLKLKNAANAKVTASSSSSTSSSSSSSSSSTDRFAAPASVAQAVFEDDGEESMTSLAHELKMEAERAQAALIAPKRNVVVTVIKSALELPQLPIKRPPVVENVRQSAARLNLTLDDLHKKILLWSYYDFENATSAITLKKVPTTFASVDEYSKILEPLLLDEFRAQLQKAKEEEAGSPIKPVKMYSISRVDNFHLVQFILVEKPKQVKDEWSIQENDLVLISNEKEIDQKPSANRLHLLGKFERKEVKKQALILHLKIVLSQNRRTKAVSDNLKEESVWYIKKVTNMSTMHREWQALASCDKLFMLPYILPTKLPERTDDNRIPSLLLEKFKSEYNDSQLQAIKSATQTLNGFSLLQGPPGTGKTRTIMGLISAIMAAPEGRKPLLICAPSNAAVDEITLRLLDGIWDEKGKIWKPNIVRLGVTQSIHPSVRSVTVEELVEKKLKSSEHNLKELTAECSEDHKEIHSSKRELDVISDQILILEKERDNGGVDSERLEQIKLKIEDLKRQKYQVTKDLTQRRTSSQEKAKRLDKMKQNLIREVLNDAMVVCATLSTSGWEVLLSLNHSFETVLIDEAAQAVELSTLIPLRHGCKRCVLVGDPSQLPATVISKNAADHQYERSLFERLQSCWASSTSSSTSSSSSSSSSYPVDVLKVQYRMHPLIREFPSLHFYQNKLEDGPNVKRYEKQFYRSLHFRPLTFFDLRFSIERRSSSSSLRNTDEAKLAAELYRELLRSHPAETALMTVGVISPYKDQVSELRSQFARVPSSANVDINTVDGFQGREKDIIIVSCVRAHGPGEGIGFLADIRRMNVALTRARFALFVIGNSKALERNQHWKDFLDFAKAQHCFISVQPPVENFFRRLKQPSIPASGPPSSSSSSSRDDSSSPRQSVKRPLESSFSSGSSSREAERSGVLQKKLKVSSPSIQLKRTSSSDMFQVAKASSSASSSGPSTSPRTVRMAVKQNPSSVIPSSSVPSASASSSSSSSSTSAKPSFLRSSKPSKILSTTSKASGSSSSSKYSPPIESIALAPVGRKTSKPQPGTSSDTSIVDSILRDISSSSSSSSTSSSSSRDRDKRIEEDRGRITNHKSPPPRSSSSSSYYQRGREGKGRR